MRRLVLSSVVSLSVLAFAATARADEGQWTPDQIAELDQAELKALGLELTPEELWNAAGDEKTGGLMRAAINLGGCSAAFVSDKGLIATNHHCAYGALQANSTPEHDYLKDGFLAKNLGEELEAKGRPVRVLRRIEDVTTKIDDATKAAGDDLAARAKAIEHTEKTLVAECEKTEGSSCLVASFYNGSTYRLFEYLELKDVRLVYAPPAAIGEYGGEVDNWMWPRHTGDFSLLRAYVSPDGKPAEFSPDNVPYTPARHLKVSTQGVGPDDFVAVLGYPGRTQRYMPAAEVRRWVDQVLPLTVDLYGEWIEILEAHAERDEAVAIKVAATKKGLANRHKNSRGMLDGISHMNLVDRRRKEDAQLAAWVKDGHGEYATVLPMLEAESATAEVTHVHDTLLRSLARGPKTLGIAIDLVRRAESRQLPDLERPSAYMDRAATKLWKSQEGRLRDFDAGVDAEVLAMFMARNAALPADQRISSLPGTDAKPPGDRAAQLDEARKLVDATKLADAAEVEKLWAIAPEALAKVDDPMLVLARGVVDELEALEAREEKETGARTITYPRYFEMLEAVRKGPIYPDANGTLRFSYATVKGYDKWDGQTQTPQTVLAGAVAKHQGKTPFDLPQAIRDAAPKAKESRWADPRLGDVPLCFLSTADTTGGNSGSPVVNGKGELVGFNFDRVWENIAGDFGYNPGHSRNVTADVRYLLWILDDVADAGHLLEEMGVGNVPEAPAAEGEADGEEDPKTKAAGAGSSPRDVSKGGCACEVDASPNGGTGVLLLLGGLFGICARRRRR